MTKPKVCTYRNSFKLTDEPATMSSFVYQTDETGYYPKGRTGQKVKNHGSIRGWVKTDEDGKYTIYTTRPAPIRTVHLLPISMCLSKNLILITNTTLMTLYLMMTISFCPRKVFENRGGSGILRTLVSGDLQIAEHNIILASIFRLS